MPNTLQNPVYREIIDRLAQARVEAGLTQKKLATRLGKPQSYIAKVEGYERRLDVLEFLIIAEQIGIDPSFVIKLGGKHLR